MTSRRQRHLEAGPERGTSRRQRHLEAGQERGTSRRQRHLARPSTTMPTLQHAQRHPTPATSPCLRNVTRDGMHPGARSAPPLTPIPALHRLDARRLQTPRPRTFCEEPPYRPRRDTSRREMARTPGGDAGHRRSGDCQIGQVRLRRLPHRATPGQGDCPIGQLQVRATAPSGNSEAGDSQVRRAPEQATAARRLHDRASLAQRTAPSGNSRSGRLPHRATPKQATPKQATPRSGELQSRQPRPGDCTIGQIPARGLPHRTAPGRGDCPIGQLRRRRLPGQESNAARAAARRAMGTRKGEQET